MSRIGIFGGGFDPIHLGHLILAEQCREQAALDQVLFVPTATGPFKPQGPVASDLMRVEMLTLAIGGHVPFQVSTIELDRGGVSYTVDTLEWLHAQQPGNEWFLLMGGDALSRFPDWRDPQRICELALPLVVRRPTAPPPDLTRLQPLTSPERYQQILEFQFDSRLIDISSTDIRQRVATGRSIRYLTPRAVEKYIETKRLYLS